MASTGVTIVNSVRKYATASYQESVPLLTGSNLTDVGNAIINFTPVYNEFLSVLFNKIAIEIMDARKYSNPFRALIKGGSPLGGTIQNTQVNPARSMPYDVNATSRLLQNYRPDVVTEYYNINRKDVFAVTRARQELELAFTSYEALDSFFTTLIDSLYNGNEIREFQLFKSVMAISYLDSIIRKVSCTTPTDEATAFQFLLKLQQLSIAFSYPSTNYNNYQTLAANKGFSVSPRVTWSPEDRQIIIMDSALAPVIGLYVKSSAFQEQYTRLAGRIMYVDNFGVTGMLAIIADESWLQVRDSKREFRDFDNGATLTLNAFFHVWQYYNICTWANAIALYDPDVEPIEITLNDGVDLEVTAGESLTVPVLISYKDTDYSEEAFVDFISSTNNVVYGYIGSKQEMVINTTKYSTPGEYTVLITATINVNGVMVSNSIIANVTVN